MTGFLLYTTVTLAPIFAVMAYVVWRDRHEQEPRGMLFRMFAYGILSVFITLILSSAVDLFVEIDQSTQIGIFVYAFFQVALIEELSKYVFVRGVVYNNAHFNEPFDAIVYAVMVSMGFAALENVLYVSGYGLGTGVLRAFTAVPAHATFAVMMGYFMGIQKFGGPDKANYGTYGLLVATFFHGAYDFFLMSNYTPGIWIGAFVSLSISLWLSNKAMKMHSDRSPFRLFKFEFFKKE